LDRETNVERLNRRSPDLYTGAEALSLAIGDAVRSMLNVRRRALTGYVVSVELGEATIVSEEGTFAFQVPARAMRAGQSVRFVREGDHFEIV